MLFELYRAEACVACFEGEENTNLGEGQTADGQTSDTTSTHFTQDDVNRMLAEDRRKHQAQLKQMETRLTEVLNGKNLTENERKALQENLTAVQGQLRSKEQQSALEKQQLEEEYQGRLADLEKKSGTWESLYRDSTIARSLQDAAMKNEAFSPSQIVTLLKPMTKLLEETDPNTKRPSGLYKVVVEMPDTDPKNGDTVMMVRSPEEAVKRMKEMPESYGNLFKSGVVSGIGSGSATGGLLPGQSGRVDVRKLTPQQYREIRQKNPELLGLRPNKGNR